MRTGIRAAAIGGLGIVTAVGTAACGSGGPSPATNSHTPASAASTGGSGAGQAVQTAYRTTMGKKTTSFTFQMNTNSNGSGGSVTGSGRADLVTNAYTMRMNVTGSALQVLITKDTEYIHVPAAERSRIPGHKSWVSVNVKKVSRAELGKELSPVLAAGSTGPAQALGVGRLAAVSDAVTREGGATVGGVRTTEYRAKVSLRTLARRARASESAKAAAAVRREEKQFGANSLYVDVWVDAHHLVRKIELRMPISAAGGTVGSGKATLTMNFTGYGAPIHLNPPPASETFDITGEVLKQAKPSSG